MAYKTYAIRNSQTASNPQSKAKVLDFLKTFDTSFEQQVQEFATFIQFVKDMPEYQSFAPVLPFVPADILAKINNTVKAIDVERDFRDLNYSQVTKSYLNIKRELYGLQLPVQFRLYGAFESNVRSDYSIVLANPAYR